jgi:hypothetical protein
VTGVPTASGQQKTEKLNDISLLKKSRTPQSQYYFYFGANDMWGSDQGSDAQMFPGTCGLGSA